MYIHINYSLICFKNTSYISNKFVYKVHKRAITIYPLKGWAFCQTKDAGPLLVKLFNPLTLKYRVGKFRLGPNPPPPPPPFFRLLVMWRGWFFANRKIFCRRPKCQKRQHFDVFAFFFSFLTFKHPMRHFSIFFCTNLPYYVLWKVMIIHGSSEGRFFEI